MLVYNHQHLQGQPGQQGLAGGWAVVGDGKVAVVGEGERRLAVEEGGRQGQTVSWGLG